VSCPCGSGPSLEECCGPIVRGERAAETAEALMRARYTAYTLGAVDFILATHAPDAAEDTDREGTEQWSKRATWLGLEVKAIERGTAQDEDGTVEFVAHYQMDGRRIAHHERSKFRRHSGKWRYVEGVMVKPEPVRVGPKVGRNDPCPCGSGKKHKRCCLGTLS
jgi:SEC-C motif-containing protein